LKSCRVLRDPYDDERDKAVFYNTTPDLQDQDQDQDRFFWYETGLVLRPTVSDHINVIHAVAAETGRLATHEVYARCVNTLQAYIIA